MLLFKEHAIFTCNGEIFWHMRFKNKITVFFDKERKQNLRVFLHTLEQTNVFIQFIRRCTTLQYIGYTQESYKNGAWKQVNEQEFEMADTFAASRADAAPYKLEIALAATNKCAAFKFVTYYFSSLDIDYFTNLIIDGTRTADVSISAFVRNRETKEWQPYKWSKGVPYDIAADYLSLSSENRAQADSFIQRLTHV